MVTLIYDCFNFFNELDLLEIRLRELEFVVDKFVLVESTRTFQKESKPLFFEENKDRFREFSDKIIHIVVDNFPGFFAKFRVPTAWDYSNYQKNQIMRGLRDCKPDDIIIFSDLDEIPRAHKVLEYKDVPGTKIFQQRFYSYFLNCAFTDCPEEDSLVKQGNTVYWKGSIMDEYRNFKTPKEFRKRRNFQGETYVQIEDGGWHFSYLGGLESVMYKLRSLEHASESAYSFDYLDDPEKVEELICRGLDLYGRDFKYGFIPIDETYPEYILKNIDKFQHLIKKN